MAEQGKSPDERARKLRYDGFLHGPGGEAEVADAIRDATAELQAKLEQAERERDLLAGKHAGVFVTERHHRETLAAAESALAAAQGALREARQALIDASVGGLADGTLATLLAEIAAALAAESGKPEPRAAPPALLEECDCSHRGPGNERRCTMEPTEGGGCDCACHRAALPAELSGKGEQDEIGKLRSLLARSNMPCIYCGLASTETGRCESGFPGCGRMDDLVLAEERGLPSDGLFDDLAEPGEAKKEEGA